MNRFIIRVIIFIFGFLLLLYCVTKVLWLAPTPITNFYDEPNNSLDVVYLGSSNAYAHFNTVLAYDLYGYTTGLFSTDSQPFSLIKYGLMETQKYQKPTVTVIDIAKVSEKISTFSSEEIRKTTDSMRFSRNRINAINDVLSYKTEVGKNEYLNYYFSFFMYHNVWKDPTKQTILGNNALYKGYLFNEYTSKIEPQNTYKWDQNVLDLNKENKQILISLIDYIKLNDLNVIFVVPVRKYDSDVNKQINDAIRIIKDNNLNVINFNDLEDFNTIDFSTDLYNSAHINVYGATKYTLFFSKYLKDNYELENHKNNRRYDSWNKEYERFKNNFKKITNKNFDNYLLGL